MLKLNFLNTLGLHLIETSPHISLNKFQTEIVDFFITESVKQISMTIRVYGNESEGLLKPDDRMITVLTFDYCKKVLAMLAIKYPLVIPYIAEYKLRSEELRKGLSQEDFYENYVKPIESKNGEVNWLEFIFETEKVLSVQAKSPLFMALMKSNYNIYYNEEGNLRKISESWSDYLIQKMSAKMLLLLETTDIWKSEAGILNTIDYISKIKEFLFQDSYQDKKSYSIDKNLNMLLKIFQLILQKVPLDLSSLLFPSKFFIVINRLVSHKPGYPPNWFLKTLNYRKYYYYKYFMSLIKSSQVQDKTSGNEVKMKNKDEISEEEILKKGLAISNINMSLKSEKQNADYKCKKIIKTINSKRFFKNIASQFIMKTYTKYKNEKYMNLISDKKSTYDFDGARITELFESLRKNSHVLKRIFKSEHFFTNLEVLLEYIVIDQESIETIKVLDERKEEDPGLMEAIFFVEMINRPDSESDEEINSIKKEGKSEPISNEEEDPISIILEVEKSLEEEKNSENLEEEEEEKISTVEEPYHLSPSLASTDNIAKFNLQERGFPPDALGLYHIDIPTFIELSEELQIEALTMAKEEYEIQKQMLSRKESEKQYLSVLEHEERRALAQVLDEKFEDTMDRETVIRTILGLSDHLREKLLHIFTTSSISNLKNDNLIKMHAKTMNTSNSNPSSTKLQGKNFEELDSRFLSLDTHLFRSVKKSPEEEKLLDNKKIHQETYSISDDILERVLLVLNFNLSCVKKTRIFSERYEDKCEDIFDLLKTLSFNATAAGKIIDYLLFSVFLYHHSNPRFNKENPSTLFASPPNLVYPEKTQNGDGSINEEIRLEEKITRVLNIIYQFLEEDICLNIFFEGYFDPWEGISFKEADGNFLVLPCLPCLKAQRSNNPPEEGTSRTPLKEIFSQFIGTLNHAVDEICLDIKGMLNELIIHVENKEHASLIKFPYYPIILEKQTQHSKFIEESENLVLKIFNSAPKEPYHNLSKILPTDMDGWISGLIAIIELIIIEPSIKMKNVSKYKKLILKSKEEKGKENKMDTYKRNIYRIWHESSDLSSFFDKLFKFTKELCSNLEHHIKLRWDRYYSLPILMELKKKLMVDNLEKNFDILKEYREAEKNFLQTVIQKIKQALFGNQCYLKFYKRVINLLHYFQSESGFGVCSIINNLQMAIDSFCILVYTLSNKSDDKSTEDQNAENNLPTLSKMISYELGEVRREEPKMLEISTSNEDKQLTLESLLKMLVTKITNLLSEKNTKKDDLLMESFVFFIENYPGSFDISTQTKFDYLKFTSKKQVQASKHYNHRIELKIDRQQIWSSTLRNIMSLDIKNFILAHLKISFENEGGYDMGGLRNEWLTLSAAEILNPNIGLFKLSANKLSLQPNPFSYLVPDHLTHFKYLGYLIGKCLIEELPFQANFVKFFLKHILRRSLTLEDLEDIDPSIYKSIKWLLDNNLNEFDDLNITFTCELRQFGISKMMELVPDGHNKLVTEENKIEYIKKFCNALMAESINEQTQAFIKGFEEIIPRRGFILLEERELSMKLSGISKIDIKEMRRNTDYMHFTPEDDYLKIWFWEILESFDQETLSEFLFFISGCTKLPSTGFKDFRVKIFRSDSGKESLPIAHTCFNQIDIPKYASLEVMKSKILIALKEGYKGFHII